jgi:TonB family protein
MAIMKKLANLSLTAVLLVGAANAADQPERKLVNRRDPEYPAIAQKMNLHGSVKFKLWINPDGTVRRVEYVGGHPLLAESALRAVKAWTYEVAPRESTTAVEVKF